MTKQASPFVQAIPWRVAPQQCCLRFTGQKHYNTENRKSKIIFETVETFVVEPLS
jgi:hypothetical protein